MRIFRDLRRDDVEPGGWQGLLSGRVSYGEGVLGVYLCEAFCARVWKTRLFRGGGDGKLRRGGFIG